MTTETVLFRYENFNIGNQHMKGIHDPTLLGKPRTSTRRCIVNVHGEKNFVRGTRSLGHIDL